MPHTAFLDTGIAPPGTDVVGDVIDDFAVAARDWPHHPAIVHNGTTITYRDLAQRVSRIAGRFDAADASSMIGVLVSHTPAVVDQLLAVLHAGAAYCPIDAALPVARKEALAAALGVDRMFSAAQYPHESTGLRIETFEEDPAGADTALSPPSGRPSDPAYVLCTSGSTGLPKPVAVPRRALTATVRALRDLFELTPQDRVLQFASLGWDTCLEE